MIAPIREANHTEGRICYFRAGTPLHACVHQRQLDIFSRIQPVKQIEILKDETEFAISDCRQIVRTKVGSLDPIDPTLPARRSIQAPDYSHEVRFAGSGRTGNRNVLSSIDRNSDALQRGDLLTQLKVSAKIFGPDHCFLPTMISRTGSVAIISVTLPSPKPSRTGIIRGAPSGPSAQTPGPLATVPAGFQRSAAFCARSASDRESVSILTLAVMPRSSSIFGFSIEVLPLQVTPFEMDSHPRLACSTSPSHSRPGSAPTA